MRKIYFNPRIHGTEPAINFDFFEKDSVVVKHEDGTIIETKITKHQYERKRNLTVDEIIKIEQCNRALDTPMTDEEIDYMLTNGMGRQTKFKPEETAALAGYRVEKKIIPL